MGKMAKGSRKGKKAWRANISTDEIDDYFIKATKDALSGGAVDSTANDSLFYVDKSTDIPLKRKIEKHREKVLHVDSVMQSNPFVQPIPSSKRKEAKNKRKLAPVENNATHSSMKVGKDSGSGITDIWSDEGEATKVKKKKKSKPVASHIPAVEVEPPGCSFNPPFEAHQDALAEAVAIEMKKSYRKELEPEPLPFVAPVELDEEDKFFLDADVDADVDEYDIDNGENADALLKRISKSERVTRVQLNRRARQKERVKAEAEANHAKQITKDIDCLDDIIKDIAKDDEEKQRKHIRRVVAKQERLKCAPPRLGKYKFEPAPPQVLLSEEITGSLRKLKGSCTLARDCYKSLEKRGLVPIAKRSRN